MTYQPAYPDNLLARSCSSNGFGTDEILPRTSLGVNDRNIFITIGRRHKGRVILMVCQPLPL